MSCFARLQNTNTNDQKKQNASQRRAKGAKGLIMLSFAALGVVYGDLSTSPLYALSAMFTAPPSPTEVSDALSLFFWALTLLPLIKYCGFVMNADDHGEGAHSPRVWF